METNERQLALEWIASVNAVEGFNPTAVAREVASEENPGQKEYFLPLIWKKAWARKKFPHHRCHATITDISDGVVTAEARFYEDKSDGEDEFIGEGHATSTVDSFNPDPVSALSNAKMLALGSAKTRAYTDAGFGYQFWTDDCMDDMMQASIKQMEVPAPIELPVIDACEGAPIPLAASDKGTEDEQTPETQGRVRKTQYEVAKESNDELIRLAGQIPTLVECLSSAAVGSTEHDAAQKRLDAVNEKWQKLAADIASKMTKPSVQEAKSKDPDYNFFAKTYDQVVEEAKNYYSGISETDKPGDKTDSFSPITSLGDNITPCEDPVSSILFEIDTAKQEKESDSSFVPLVSEVREDVITPSVPEQTAVFVMSVDQARDTVSSCGSYSGKRMGEIYDNKTTRQILPMLFERSYEKEERAAIKTIIEQDADLSAYCERKGRLLEV